MTGARWRGNAFTLAEVIVTFALLALVVLAMLGLALSSVKVSSKSSDETRAVLIGKHYLDQQLQFALKDQPPGTRASFFDHDHPTNPWQSQEILVGPTRFRVVLSVQTVQSQATGLPLGTQVDANNRLKKIEAQVTWWQDGLQNRSGYGRLETRLTQLVAEGGL